MPISPRFVVNFTVLLLSVGFLVLFGIIGMTVWLGERAQIYFDEASSLRDLRIAAVELRSALQSAESSERGFLIGGKSIRDFARVWAEEGLDAVRKVAKKSPEAFVAIAARICPNDIRLTLEQAIPGGMTLEDYSLMREVIAAIRESLPDCRPIAARRSISACARGAA
jgi:hypothetical protein